MKKLIALSVLPLLLLSGCATLRSPARIHALKPGAPYLADFDASRRGALLLPRPDGKGMMYCAEPSPDVAYNSVLSLVASVQLQNPNIDASTQLQFSQSVVELAQRTETIQFLREALYRLCEQSLNGTMGQTAVEQEYDNALKTALALAEADLSKTNPALAAQLAADPKLADLWKKLVSTNPPPATPLPNK